MIICFECQPGTKKLLDQLASSGGYADYADVIAAAVANQALLHSKVGSQRSFVITAPESVGESQHERGPSAVPAVVQVGGLTPGVAAARESGATGGSKSRLLIPELFTLDGLSETVVPPVDPPDDVWGAGQEVPISRWLFGQYNKLLPAKASCRAIARLLTAEPEGVALAAASSKIADAAALLGGYLSVLDGINGVIRDEALATAFPKSGEGGDKSRLRFASQFVAWTNSHGQLSGLLMGLKLINRTKHKELRIKLTNVGWQLALLRSPVLDAEGVRKARKLSDEECLLLLEHISSAVPAEDFAYRAVLNGIEEGANTPESLDAFLTRTVSPGEELTKEFIATQRSGVVSRMVDLGMITRVREGVRVSYAVSQRAHDYVMQRSQ